MGSRHSAVMASMLVLTGCGLAHERGAGADAGPITIVGDADAPRPDAFVPRPDAWVPPFTPAPHGPAPIVPDQGGPRIRALQLVVITYADDPDRPLIESEARWLVSSSWLRSVGAEYGVASASLLGVIERTDAAPARISGDGIAALINLGIANHTLPTPTTGVLGDALYAIYFPPHTTVDDPQIGTSCVAFGGYHNEAMTPDGRSFAYAVLPSCPTDDPTLTDWENEQVTITHEVIEAATDPRPLGAPAFAMSQMSATISPWLFAGAELADLCEYRSGPGVYAHEAGFVATRVWSNVAAAANDRDPCVPLDPGVPYASISVSPADVQPANPGETVIFDVAGWSTALVSSLQISAGPAPPTMFSFAAGVTIDRNTINNGEHATLRVTVPFGTPSNQYGLVYVFLQDAFGNSDVVPVVVYTP